MAKFCGIASGGHGNGDGAEVGETDLDVDRTAPTAADGVDGWDIGQIGNGLNCVH